jgi:hypothetical protein
MQHVDIGTPKKLIVDASPCSRHSRQFNNSDSFRQTLHSQGRDRH